MIEVYISYENDSYRQILVVKSSATSWFIKQLFLSNILHRISKSIYNDELWMASNYGENDFYVLFFNHPAESIYISVLTIVRYR